MRPVQGNTANSGTWCPDEATVAGYHRRGWLITPPILPGDLLDAAWRSIQSYLDGIADHEIAMCAEATDQRRSRGDPLDQLGYLSLRLDDVRRLVTNSPLGEIAARLTGADAIRLFHDRLIIKPPDPTVTTSVGWHTDRAYWRTCSSERMLTAWVPFHDVDVTMGPLLVMTGSHRWRVGTHMATSHRSDMDDLLREAAGQRRLAPPATMTMRRGQVSFHDCRALHGSLPNHSDRVRAALAVHLQPGDNRYQLVMSSGGRRIGHTNDLLCRAASDGAPDYTDPEVFPDLWRDSDR